jgi:hypothetical protein
VAEGVQAAFRLDKGLVGGGKDHPEVPSVSATMPGCTAPDADRLGRLVAAAGDDRRAGAQPGQLPAASALMSR